MPVNPALYNAAIVGLTGGAQQRWLTENGISTFNGLSAVIVGLATEIDALLPPTSSATPTASVLMMQSICQGVMANRFPQTVNATAIATWARAIVQLFFVALNTLDSAGAAAQETPFSGVRYVNPNFNGANPPTELGTQGNPFRTIQAAANSLTNGGIIYLASGDYNGENVNLTNIGNDNSWILQGLSYEKDDNTIIGTLGGGGPAFNIGAVTLNTGTGAKLSLIQVQVSDVTMSPGDGRLHLKDCEITGELVSCNRLDLDGRSPNTGSSGFSNSINGASLTTDIISGSGFGFLGQAQCARVNVSGCFFDDLQLFNPVVQSYVTLASTPSVSNYNGPPGHTLNIDTWSNNFAAFGGGGMTVNII